MVTNTQPATTTPLPMVLDNRQFKSRLTILAAIGAVVVVLDQLAKAWIRNHLVPGQELDVLPGIMHLSHVHNRGAAWSMLSGQRWLLIAITGAVIIGLLSVARSFVARGPLGVCCLGLILGGAVGNLIDRIVQGYVTDMIDMDTSWNVISTFPVFNLADSALTLGVMLLLWLSFRPETEKDPENGRTASP